MLIKIFSERFKIIKNGWVITFRFFNDDDENVTTAAQRHITKSDTSHVVISPTPSVKINVTSGRRHNSTSASSLEQDRDFALDLNFIMQSVMSRRHSYLQKQVEDGILGVTYGNKNNVTASMSPSLSTSIGGGHHHAVTGILSVEESGKMRNRTDDDDIMAIASVYENVTDNNGSIGDEKDVNNVRIKNKTDNTTNKHVTTDQHTSSGRKVGDKLWENPRLLMEELMMSYRNRTTPQLTKTPTRLVVGYLRNATKGE